MLGLGAFRSMASRDARSLGFVFIAESTVTPVPIPRKNTPARRALEREEGRRRPVVFPKGEGMSSVPSDSGEERSSMGRKRRRCFRRGVCGGGVV